MSAGSGSAQTVVVLEAADVSNYRTALEIERQTVRAWQQIADCRLQTIRSLQRALERYQRRSPN